MMQWDRKGLIFGANRRSEWMDNSALQPTPIILGNKIRVFCGFRDKEGVGSIGYVDVDANNPANVLGFSEKPCLTKGVPGAFDDNGVVPCAVIKENGKLYVYYAGYNVSKHVRMTVYSGLAVSDNDGETFHRVKQTPIMERTDNELLFRAVHTALKTEKCWLIYYGAGNRFLQGKKKTLPVYEVKLLKTQNFTELSQEGSYVLRNEGNEYRVGRPYVVYDKNRYRMFFGAGTEDVTYKLAYAESDDGEHWIRMDNELNLPITGNGFDSEMMAYPAFVRYENKAYLFYNGNNYGYEGFGYAELISE